MPQSSSITITDGTVSVTAARKRKERENTEKVKARLRAILDDCASSVPLELGSGPKKTSRRGAKRKTIDLEKLLYDCIIAVKWFLDEGARNVASSSSSSTMKDQPGPLTGGEKGKFLTSPSQPMPLPQTLASKSHLRVGGPHEIMYSHRQAWLGSSTAGTMLIRSSNLPSPSPKKPPPPHSSP